MAGKFWENCLAKIWGAISVWCTLPLYEHFIQPMFSFPGSPFRYLIDHLELCHVTAQLSVNCASSVTASVNMSHMLLRSQFTFHCLAHILIPDMTQLLKLPCLVRNVTAWWFPDSHLHTLDFDSRSFGHFLELRLLKPSPRAWQTLQQSPRWMARMVCGGEQTFPCGLYYWMQNDSYPYSALFQRTDKTKNRRHWAANWRVGCGWPPGSHRSPAFTVKGQELTVIVFYFHVRHASNFYLRQVFIWNSQNKFPTRGQVCINWVTPLQFINSANGNRRSVA